MRGRGLAAAYLGDMEAGALDCYRSLDLEQRSVDGVYGRLVLMYVPEPAVRTLIGRVARWLRPGGACALAEFCNYRHFRVYPPSEHMPVAIDTLMRAVEGGRGCNPEIGNALPGLLARAGLEIEFHVNTKAVRATTPEWSWPDAFFREHLPGLVDAGYLAPDFVDRFFADWEERSADPAALYFSAPFMEVVGRRLAG